MPGTRSSGLPPAEGDRDNGTWRRKVPWENEAGRAEECLGRTVWEPGGPDMHDTTASDWPTA